MLSAQGHAGWQCVAQPAYNRPATKSVRLPTTNNQPLEEGARQKSSDLLCSSGWKALGWVKPNLCWGAGISLRLHVHPLSACAGGLWESQNKCMPFTCCCTSILNGKQRLLCGAWVGSELQLWQWEGGRAQSPHLDRKAQRCLLVLLFDQVLWLMLPWLWQRDAETRHIQQDPNPCPVLNYFCNPIRQDCNREVAPPWAETGSRRGSSCVQEGKVSLCWEGARQQERGMTEDLAAGAYGAVAAEPTARCMAWTSDTAAPGPRVEAGMGHPILVPVESSLGQLGTVEQVGGAGASPLAMGKDAGAGGHGVLQLLWHVPGQHKPGLCGGWRRPMQSGWGGCSGAGFWVPRMVQDAQGRRGCPGWCRDTLVDGIFCWGGAGWGRWGVTPAPQGR